MSYQDIIVERVENWMEIQINRPEKLNSVREKTAEEIISALEEAESDRAITAVILKGNEKSFCTGIDTSEFTLTQSEYFHFYRHRKTGRKINEMYRNLPSFTKPLITVVEGFALGGGLEIALLSDMLIAGEKAKFGLTEAKLGVMPGGGGTQTLPRLIGAQLAKELMWTGRRFGAAEAKEYRMVNHVTEAGKALDKARELVREISANAPVSVMLIKAAVNRGIDLPLAEGMAIESDVSFMLYASKDREEGIAAFKEKRPPKFKGE
jgi:enoyl-CoA hydratase/carnithine racemase